ncbi:hypothetical protein D3C76_1407320 [compost metagenome]
MQVNQGLAVAFGQGEIVDEIADRTGVELPGGNVVGDHGRRVAGHQFVFAEGFFIEEHAARQAQARVETAIEGCFKPLDIHPEFFQQAVDLGAVQVVG